MKKDDYKKIVEECLRENPCEIDIRYDEPMNAHTTFKVGGPADCWVRPCGEGVVSFCGALFCRARQAGVPVFVLGGGANIVVADKGIRGVVLDMGAWKGETAWPGLVHIDVMGKDEIVFKSGTTLDEAADVAAAKGLSGLEFLAGMPGTIGGAVWMNARCYGSEIADVISWTEYIDFGDEENKREIIRLQMNKEDFGYKKSPFQNMNCLILNVAFNLIKSDKDKIFQEMDKNREDRRQKGHYNFPSAGSAFKNNHDFGKPTGKIIDELGLKGLQIGGAQVAPYHGNIIINAGNATAADIRALTDEVSARVKTAAGFKLEPEILFVGNWSTYRP